MNKFVIAALNRLRRSNFRFGSIFESISTMKSNNTNSIDTSTPPPIVVVLGETGVGKTKLSVEICQRFNGEVISADSMQIYRGLDIITNKVTEDESRGVPHHLINILEPGPTNFNVQIYQNRAIDVIRDMWTNRGKMPVIVGGTNYYIEAVLWNRLIAIDDGDQQHESADEDTNDDDGGGECDNFVKKIPFDVVNTSDEELYERLKSVDPVMASRKHPKKRRSIIRSLQIYYTTGRPHSELLSEQHSKSGGNYLGGPLRFPRLCLLWLTCDDRTMLKERLRARVDEMVIRGLRTEISEFYDRYHPIYAEKYPDDVNTKGIFQSIGLKEFEKFLRLPQDQRPTAEGDRLFAEGVEQLKVITIRYAKRQRQWINNRLCRLASRDSIPIYRLDTTDVRKWTETVSPIANHVVEAFLDGRQPTMKVQVVEMDAEKLENYANEFTAENRYCPICERVISGLQWTDHEKSKMHRLRRFSKAKGPVYVRKPHDPSVERFPGLNDRYAQSGPIDSGFDSQS